VFVYAFEESSSDISNERIRQALTSAFENCGLELTFRQACTAEKTGEVEFLDVNHCVTTEDDFDFVTKDCPNEALSDYFVKVRL